MTFKDLNIGDKFYWPPGGSFQRLCVKTSQRKYETADDGPKLKCEVGTTKATIGRRVTEEA